MYGLWLGYQAVGWLWAGHALTASRGRIGSVVAQAVVGFGLVGWIVIRTIRHNRRRERQRAQMIAELRAGRALPAAPSLEPFGANVPIRQEKKPEVANITRGE
jgi:hypothetical protein